MGQIPCSTERITCLLLKSHPRGVLYSDNESMKAIVEAWLEEHTEKVYFQGINSSYIQKTCLYSVQLKIPAAVREHGK